MCQLPAQKSESHSGSGDPELGEIYNVVIPIVQKMQVENQ